MTKRNHEIKIRFTKEELDALNDKAGSCNMKREQYCRTVLGGTVPHEFPPVDYYNLIVALRQVGSDINRLLDTVKFNNTDETMLKDTIESYRKTEHMIWEAFSPEKRK